MREEEDGGGGGGGGGGGEECEEGNNETDGVVGPECEGDWEDCMYEDYCVYEGDCYECGWWILIIDGVDLGDVRVCEWLGPASVCEPTEEEQAQFVTHPSPSPGSLRSRTVITNSEDSQ